MAGERKAVAVLAFLGYAMEQASDRSSNVFERAVLQCARTACLMFARKIAAGAVPDEHWRFLAGIEAPPVPAEPPKPKHTPFRPYVDDYRSWKDGLVSRDGAEGDDEMPGFGR